MPFDGIFIHGITNELNQELQGQKIEKVHQPEKDEIVINFRKSKLVISASSNNPRIHFTDYSKTNPQKPLNFCMLLRKYIQGGRVIKVMQPKLERIINIHIETFNELGDLVERILVVEIMGKHSNIILVDHNGKVLDSIKRVDLLTSSKRQILPGILYEMPPAQDKIDFFSLDYNLVKKILSENSGKIKERIFKNIEGISPLIAEELVYQSAKGKDHFDECSENEIEILVTKILKLKDLVQKNEFTPCVFSLDNKKLFYCFILRHLNGFEVNYFNTLNEAADNYYYITDKLQRIKNISSNLERLLKNNIERCQKKIVIQTDKVNVDKKMEQAKLFGDLITANMHLISDGDQKVNAINYYSDEMEEIEIKLEENLSPSKNAQKYFKKYNKLKSGKAHGKSQLVKAKNELDYLLSVKDHLERASEIEDVTDIKLELESQGYIKKQVQKSKSNDKPSKPHFYISSDGFEIYAGRNNIQNDQLTLRFAKKSDLWLHTKEIPGSHVIVKGYNKLISETAIKEGALIAAYHSKGSHSNQIPVDYTEVANVRKPNGAKPGMVIYDHYNTIYVNIDQTLIKEMKKRTLKGSE